MTDTQTFPVRLGELFDFQGKLAQFWGTWATKEAPFTITTIRVSKIGANDWPIVGQIPWNSDGSKGRGHVTLRTGGRVYVDTADWKEIKLRRPVPKPYDGKTYTWKWAEFSREWVKNYFALCSECRKQHHPIMVHCAWCGVAIRSANVGTSLCRECLSQGRVA